MDTLKRKNEKNFKYSSPHGYNIVRGENETNRKERETAMQTPAYKNYEDLIHERAWSFSKSYKMNVDEFVSIGNDAFLRAIDKWNPDKAAFTTFLYKVMNHAMLKYVNRIGHRFITNQDDKTMELKICTETTPRDILESKDDVDHMNNECRFIIRNLLDNPEVFGIEGGDSPVNIRAKIKRVLRNKFHWKYPVIWDTMRKLRIIYSNK